ncbi:class I SAM-dependent methyltransferase [Vibrio sp. JC009]|uniref:class I SAM-dependent methyltransferase n=1 Tax=Vibrio sp. JC009 TaxID=2912314 RepID=UPI0023B19FE9|nr:class I SAM-dependent methyltransferase [Vibrio sp. JC009]WED21739.1 class I SAM-dependent methyltransferase [Vibrio sp. JC009]
MNCFNKNSYSDRDRVSGGYEIPVNLLKPMWFRSRESLMEDGLVYDPIAAKACKQCQLSSECLSGDVNQKQLMYTTLTKLCDLRVQAFLDQHPNGWVINVGAGLDTRFYRLDNGLCRWLELDINENLLWRQKLFHDNERYQLRCGSVNSLEWLYALPVPENAPVLIVCEQALLDCSEKQTSQFIQALGRFFVKAQACVVLAGDKTSSEVGQKLGCETYAHGFASPEHKVFQWVPWVKWVKCYSPLDHDCNRWKFWQRMLRKFSGLKARVTPTVVEFSW